MASQKRKNDPVLIFGIAIIILIVASYIPGNIEVLGYKIKPVDLFMDIKPDSLLIYGSNIPSNVPAKVPEINKVESEENENAKFAASVSAELFEKLFDKIDSKKDEVKNTTENNVTNISNVITRDVPITGNTSQLSYFYNALKTTKTQKVRIAHYGDSEIEGDIISFDIRENLQNRFGGKGVGMLNITSQDIAFRTTTKHTFSSNWKQTNVLSGYLGTGNPSKLPIGMSGFMATPEGVSWVRYETTGKFQNIKSFNTVRIFYTNAKASSIKYSFNNGADQTANLTPGRGVKDLTLSYPSGAHSIKITTTMANQADFYGVSLEDGNGLYLDNFPWRGNTGISFRDLDEGALKDFDRLCNYKLIIINFGGNQVSSGESNYDWFESQMIKNIKNLKSTFPQCSFLLISVSDKSKKVGTRLMTDPLVLKLIESQKKIATATGIAFWNLFEAMGGMNSMVDWVNANPPLAAKDYTHTNLQGSKKIADMFTKSLLEGNR